MVLQATGRGMSYKDFTEWADPKGEGQKIKTAENVENLDKLMQIHQQQVDQAEAMREAKNRLAEQLKKAESKEQAE